MTSNTLAAELAAISSSGGWGQCRVTALSHDLTPDDYAAFLNAIADRKKTAVSIAQVMTAHGWPISDQAIQRHRRGACSCR